MFKFLINPSRFNKFTDIILKPLIIITSFTLIIGLFLIYFSPLDYQQGLTVKIMYIHVPSAWLALLTYAIMTIYSIIGLAFKIPFSFVIIKAIAPVGAVFTLLCLISGSMWGKPMWGTWWVWDARLTSVAILFIVYLLVIFLNQTFENRDVREKTIAIFILIGSINLPIIKFSVDWWNTLHQPASVIKLDGPTIHIDMMIPLILMALGFLFFYFSFLLINVQTELNNRKLKKLFIQSFSKKN